MDIKRFLKSKSFNEYLVISTAIVSFLPYYLTVVFIPLAAIYIVANPKSREVVFSQKLSIMFIIFTILTIVTALINSNWFGLGCSVFFFSIVVIMQFSRWVMTTILFEKILNICCLLSVAVAGSAIIEKTVHMLFYKSHLAYRCYSFFFNPNYMATMLALCIIICAYKVITKSGKKFLFYSIAVFDCIGVYLSGSMFVWVAILIGVSILLILHHEHHLLSIFLLLAGIMCIIISTAPEIFPRIKESVLTTENRIAIWKTSIEAIGDAPLFGKGFFTYFHIQPSIVGSYPTTHAHNLFVDSILSFGIIGSLIGAAYFSAFFSSLAKCHEKLKNNKASSFIIALSAAILVHSMIDLTLLWVQTGLLFGVLLGGIGVEEKRLIRNSQK
ncbi:MAG: O-antigen ligase family protein [Oscillospiraceae bacterium]|nr:O-antigen ligase family protein [Oscillospiraceae bacterium]